MQPIEIWNHSCTSSKKWLISIEQLLWIYFDILIDFEIVFLYILCWCCKYAIIQFLISNMWTKMWVHEWIIECNINVFEINGSIFLTIPSVEAVKNSVPAFALIQIVLYTGSMWHWSIGTIPSGFPPFRLSHQQIYILKSIIVYLFE